MGTWGWFKMIEKLANAEKINEISKSISNEKFDVDKRLDTSKETGKIKEAFDPDKRLKPGADKDLGEPKHFSDGPIGKLEEMLYTKVTDAIDAAYDEFKSNREIFPPENELFTKLEYRINQTPNNNGNWIGERGYSKFVPNVKTINKELSKFGIDGIEYERGIVDFSPVAIDSVKIPSMTADLKINKMQGDIAFAKKWNEELKGGRSDWTPRDVKNFRMSNKLDFHECSNMKTVQLVPESLHRFFTHFGGRSECRIRDGKKEVFDK